MQSWRRLRRKVNEMDVQEIRKGLKSIESSAEYMLDCDMTESEMLSQAEEIRKIALGLLIQLSTHGDVPVVKE